ncbi:MAG: hypothetical protein HQM14_21675, partial [SAR324 cluster bacterium]|nr:hypothetical protein [SAR324 cluster bacterium]
SGAVLEIWRFCGLYRSRKLASYYDNWGVGVDLLDPQLLNQLIQAVEDYDFDLGLELLAKLDKTLD